MTPSYLTHSRTAWAACALILAGFGAKAVSAAVALPAWVVPADTFVAPPGAPRFGPAPQPGQKRGSPWVATQASSRGTVRLGLG